VARTRAGNELTLAHRAAQLANQAGSLTNLIKMWQVVDVTNLGDTIDVFTRAALLLTKQGFTVSADLSANYYQLFRRVELGGEVAAVKAAPLADDVLAGQIRGAALSGIINARRAGRTVEGAARNGLVKVMGTVGKLVQLGGRMTITDSVRADPKAKGWMRVTSGSPCAFCAMISSRGPVFKSEKAATFETHDHCSCSAEPYYTGNDESATAKQQGDDHLDDYRAAQDWARRTGTLSSGTSNNALNNYRRFIAAGKPTPDAGGTEQSGNDAA
jgi:hypothetical protein